MTSERESGTLTLATCLSGTAAPYASTCRRSSSAGVARPVRIAAKSPRVASTHFCILFSASFKSAMKLSPCHPEPLEGLNRIQRTDFTDERADGFAPHDAANVAGSGHVEHDDRQIVVHAQRQRRVVHHFQAALQHLEIRELLEARRV